MPEADRVGDKRPAGGHSWPRADCQAGQASAPCGPSNGGHSCRGQRARFGRGQRARKQSSLTLLNCDYKILTRVLTRRLNPVVDSFASRDNTGFYPKRFIAENSLCLKLMQAYLDETHKPGAMVFLDMEKAFDRVSWDYLHKTLEALGFKQEFRKWISLLYDHNNPPQRRLALNGHLGSKYSLGSGVPLSLIHI